MTALQKLEEKVANAKAGITAINDIHPNVGEVQITLKNISHTTLTEWGIKNKRQLVQVYSKGALRPSYKIVVSEPMGEIVLMTPLIKY